MKSKTIIFLYVILYLITFMYSLFIWYGIGTFMAIYSIKEYGAAPLITRLTVLSELPYPYHAFPWQFLAVFFVILTTIWGIVRSKGSNSEQGHILPALCYMVWIIMCLCLHGVGAMAPFLMVVHVLG